MSKQKHDIGHQKRQRALLEAEKRADKKPTRTPRKPDNDQEGRGRD